MFKNTRSLEKCMRQILIEINDNNFNPDLENNRDLSYALYCCCEEGYIINLHHIQVVSGDYAFQKTSNTRVSKKGFEFIEATSPLGLFKQNLFSLLRGVLGFILGILSATIIALISWSYGWT